MAQPPPDKRDKDSEKTKTGAGPRPDTSEFGPLPRDRSGEVKIPPRAPAGKPVPRSSSTGVPAIDLGASKNSKEFQKHILNSTFSERSTFTSLPSPPPQDLGEDEATEIGQTFDGNTPAKEVVAVEPWKAINAPLQSREGRRSAKLYQLVLDQFAVGVNPRYEPDGPDKPRSHIFLWDVTRALNVEIPRFAGARELSLAQTCIWIRDQGPLRGWHQVDPMRALEAVNVGQPVVVMPKDIKLSLLGLMRPGDLSPDRKPILSAAARVRGNGLTIQQAFGVHAVVCYFHA